LQIVNLSAPPCSGYASREKFLLRRREFEALLSYVLRLKFFLPLRDPNVLVKRMSQRIWVSHPERLGHVIAMG
jgi:hypothetical protein